jgi:hypothetical protein
MIPKPFAFVLMPFSDVFRDTYLLGIKPACEEAGYYCERLDEQIFEETMLERIYNQIAKADLIVADLTDRNPNVFYETGYAHALGQNVILLTKNAADIPFDLKHYSHIVYSDGIAELKKQLKERASYYATHPGSTTRDPFNQFTLLLNGGAVDWAADTMPVTARLVHKEYPSRWALPIEAAFHLTDDAVENELEINVRLITPPLYDRSGWDWGGGTNQIYTTVSMPDGRVMHKPLNTVRLSSGDPDTIGFNLFPTDVSIRNVQPMILRLIASGLRRDIVLEVSYAD